VDFAHLADLAMREVFWVTRAKDNLQCRVVRRLRTGRQGNILRDDLIKLTGVTSNQAYPVWLRRVIALVEVDGEVREMVFLTNNFTWMNPIIGLRWTDLKWKSPLVQRRNPCPLGMVRKVVLLEKESAHRFSLGRCPHNETKGKNYEQIQANVTHDMALRVSHCLDAKVPVSGAAREGQRGGGVEHPGTEPAIGLRGGGVERAGGPRACIGADTAQDFDFRIHGAGEREGGLASV